MYTDTSSIKYTMMKITLFFLLLFLEYYIIALNTFPFWRNFLNQKYWTKYNSSVQVHWKMTGNNEFSLVIFKTNSSWYTKYTDEHKLHLASCLLFIFWGHPSSLSVFIHLSAEDVWWGGRVLCPPPLLLIYLTLSLFSLYVLLCLSHSRKLEILLINFCFTMLVVFLYSYYLYFCFQ